MQVNQMLIPVSITQSNTYWNEKKVSFQCLFVVTLAWVLHSVCLKGERLDATVEPMHLITCCLIISSLSLVPWPQMQNQNTGTDLYSPAYAACSMISSSFYHSKLSRLLLSQKLQNI